MKKKLYRSQNDRKIAGVIGGLADYFDIDATLLRVIFAIVFVITSFMPMFLVYIIMAIIVPNKEDVIKNDD